MTQHKTKLNANQLHILKLIYKFRYITPQLLAQYKKVLPWTANDALNRLLDKGLVARRYSNKHKLQGKAASYWLASHGIEVLKTQPEVKQSILTVRSRDHTHSDKFIDHHLKVFEVYLAIKQTYPDRFQLFTKYELPNSPNFPEDKPDLYLRAKKSGAKSYFMDIFNDVPYFVIKERIDAYIDHYDDVGRPYPSVTIVCPSTRLEKRIKDYTDSLLEDIEFRISNVNILQNKNALRSHRTYVKNNLIS